MESAPVFLGNREPAGSSHDVKSNNVCGWAMPSLGTLIDRLNCFQCMKMFHDRITATAFRVLSDLVCSNREKRDEEKKHELHHVNGNRKVGKLYLTSSTLATSQSTVQFYDKRKLIS